MAQPQSNLLGTINEWGKLGMGPGNSIPGQQNQNNWRGQSTPGQMGQVGQVQNQGAFAKTVNPQYMQAAQQSVLKPITEQLMNQVLPQVRQGAISGGQVGGTRQQLGEQQGVNQYIDRATQALSPLANQLYGQALGGDIQAGLQTQQLGNQRDLQTQQLGFQGQESQAARNQAGDLQQQQLGAQRQNLMSNIAAQMQQMIPGVVDQQMRYKNQAAGLPGNMLNAIGGQRQGLGMANQFLPFQLAQQIAGVGAGIPGGSNVSQSMANPWMSGFGGALAGYGMFNRPATQPF